jgi:hypothetical protein
MSTSDFFQIGKLYQCNFKMLGLYCDKEHNNYIGCLNEGSPVIFMVIEISNNNNIKIISSDKVGWFTCPAWAYTKFYKQIVSPSDI